MIRRSLLLLVLAKSGVACSEPPPPVTETFEPPAGGWMETWRDDFDGPAQSAPDAARWNLEVRAGGLNDELNYNTDDRKNSFLDGSGNLVLQALLEQYVDPSGKPSELPYTSARLNTRGKLDQAYGKFEARIKLPLGGRGVWPAFWLLGSDYETSGWPDCGEVDILEWRGSEPTRVISSLHGPRYYGGDSYNAHHDLSTSYSDDFHVFTFEWTPDAVRWSIDQQPFYVKTAAALANRTHDWVYDHPFFIILNLAVGGIFDGDPTPSTVFPQQMLVDYVSVSQPVP
jgi:beta-glucanase (GH16 family)